MQTLQEMAELSAAPFAKMREMAAAAFGFIQSAAIAHNSEVAEQWHDLSPWQRAAYRVGGVAVSTAGVTLALQAARTTGAAAHGLETGGLDSFGQFNVELPSGPHRTAVLEEPAMALTTYMEQRRAQPEILSLAPASHNDFDLPADIDTAPDPQALGDYDARTGEGTVWHQAVEYADDLGFDDLTESEKHELTGRILAYNDLSWSEARDLSAGYEPEMPTQRTMEEWLDQAGADRTHAADRPPVVPDTDPGDTGAGTDTGDGSGTDTGRRDGHPGDGTGATTAAAPGAPSWDENCDGRPDWWPLHAPEWWPIREEVTNDNCRLDWTWGSFWTAVGLAGVLGVAYGGQRALNRGKAEQRLRRQHAAAETDERVLTEEEVERLNAQKARETRSLSVAALRERLRMDRIRLRNRNRRRRADADTVVK